MIKKFFDFDDFIGEEIAPKVEKKIDPKSKISDFSKIKISAIDPRLRSEIEDRIKNIEQNLNKLKHIS